MNLFTMNLLLWLDYRFFESGEVFSCTLHILQALALSLFFSMELALSRACYFKHCRQQL